ncbi:MAG: hypothetical protein IPI05_04990 [Flavobacteriales bacterium]|nr:hypothetical protein [Flavobacteriales bacterium]
MLLVFPLVLVLRREWRRLPHTMIKCCSSWRGRYGTYGNSGISTCWNAEAGITSLRGVFVRTLALLTAVGAVAPFTPVFLRALVPKRARMAVSRDRWHCHAALAFSLCVYAV